MSRLLLASGKIASQSDLRNDDLVKEMIEEARIEGARGAPTKESVIQSLTVEDISKLFEALSEKDLEGLIKKKTSIKKSILRQMREERI